MEAKARSCRQGGSKPLQGTPVNATHNLAGGSAETERDVDARRGGAQRGGEGPCHTVRFEGNSTRNLVEMSVKKMSLYREILRYYHEHEWRRGIAVDRLGMLYRPIRNAVYVYLVDDPTPPTVNCRVIFCRCWALSISAWFSSSVF